MDQWWCGPCPECKASNWVNNGDIEDCSVSDVEGIKCWNCSHSWVFPGLDLDEDWTIEDAYIKDGRHFEEQF